MISLRRRLLACAELDKSLRRLAAILVGDADDRHFLHGGVLVNRLLDPARIDVEARAEDEILDAVDDIGEAVAIHVGDVAGAEKFAHKGRRGFLGLLPISFHDLRARDANLALFAQRNFLVRVSKLRAAT